jgi:hypothetical protein
LQNSNELSYVVNFPTVVYVLLLFFCFQVSASSPNVLFRWKACQHKVRHSGFSSFPDLNLELLSDVCVSDRMHALQSTPICFRLLVSLTIEAQFQHLRGYTYVTLFLPVLPILEQDRQSLPKVYENHYSYVNFIYLNWIITHS